MRTSIASTFLLVALGTACPRDQDEPPGQDDTGTGADGDDDDDGTGMTADDDTADDDDDGPTDPSGVDSTDDDGGSETGTDCEGPDGCWNCAPTDPLQLLNACTDSQCDAFPNTPERLPLLERDGSLPPIP